MRLALTLALASLPVLVPRLAEACSPPLPGVSETLPVDGGSYPANAAIGLYGHGLSAEGLAGTVDGTPVALSVATTPGPRRASLSLTLDPAPTEGQSVHITGTACDGGGGTECDVDLTFTATAPDLDPPTVSGGVLQYDVHDYPNVVADGGSCMSSSDQGHYVNVTVESVTDDYPELAYWEVIGFVQGPEDVRARRTAPIDGATASVSFHLANLQDVDPADVCFRVDALDPAGHRTTVAESCAACRLVDDDDGSTLDVRPPEPAWTAADVRVGGPCDDGTATGAGGGPTGSGGGATSSGTGGNGNGPGEPTVVSGCQAGGAPSSYGGWLAVLGALAFATRRRW